MTVKQYLTDTKLTESVAKVLEIIHGEVTIVRLDSTIFHPQGGGQKADIGQIGTAVVTHDLHNGDHVDQYVQIAADLAVGDLLDLKIDPDWRRLNAVYHSAGHLIAAVLETMHPHLLAVSAHQWPGEARVEFAGDISLAQLQTEEINARLAADLTATLAVTIEGDPLQKRSIQIGHYPPIPCGGTHVCHLGEIAKILVTGIKVKGGRIRVSFEALPSSDHS
jgi:alanyl-tRNA synthetase